MTIVGFTEALRISDVFAFKLCWSLFQDSQYEHTQTSRKTPHYVKPLTRGNTIPRVVFT